MAPCDLPFPAAASQTPISVKPLSQSAELRLIASATEVKTVKTEVECLHHVQNPCNLMQSHAVSGFPSPERHF